MIYNFVSIFEKNFYMIVKTKCMIFFYNIPIYIIMYIMKHLDENLTHVKYSLILLFIIFTNFNKKIIIRRNIYIFILEDSTILKVVILLYNFR